MEKNSKIYVAGHGWLVWSAVVRKFQSEGCINLVLKTRKELDLFDQQAVSSFFKQEQLDCVVLCAAKVWWVTINASYPFDMLYENIQIQNNIIWAAHINDVKKLLFVASSTIYPSECIQPIKESSLFKGDLDPLHESYGLAKICGIKLCEKSQKQSGNEFFSLVPTNIYGEWDHFEEWKSHVIWSLMTRFHQAKQASLKEVTVWWSWNALREFLYVDDIADATYFFMTHTISSSHINIGTDEEISIKDLAYMIKEIVWYEWSIVFDTTKPEWRLRRKLDTTLASSCWWNAKVTMKEWLQKTYQYFLSTL